MPLYERECVECSHIETILRPVREATKTHYCEQCGSQTKLIPSVPAWFKPGRYGKGMR